MDSLSGVGVLDKAMAVLGSLRHGAQSLAELQASTHLPRATAHRLAVALEAHGMVRRDDDGRFAYWFRPARTRTGRNPRLPAGRNGATGARGATGTDGRGCPVVRA